MSWASCARRGHRLALPGHFKTHWEVPICSLTDLARGADGRSGECRKRAGSMAVAVSRGARGQEAAELGAAIPARAAAWSERAQEPTADGGEPGTVRAR